MAMSLQLSVQAQGAVSIQATVRADQPVANQPVIDQPVINQPVANQPVNEPIVVEETVCTICLEACNGVPHQVHRAMGYT